MKNSHKRKAVEELKANINDLDGKIRMATDVLSLINPENTAKVLNLSCIRANLEGQKSIFEIMYKAHSTDQATDQPTDQAAEKLVRELNLEDNDGFPDA